MSLHNVRWILPAGGVVAAEAALIGAAFGWVAVYSYLIEPGHPAAFYQEYAQIASPWVSVILGVPVFFAICRWIRRRAPLTAMPTAIAVFALYCLLEAPMFLGAINRSLALFTAVSLPTKFLGCYLGVRLPAPGASAERA